MGVKVALEHRTTYTSTGWSMRPHVVRLAPRRTAGRPSRPTRCASSRAALPQLAAGPVRQPPRPARVPRADPRAGDHRRSGRRHGGDQPFRLLRRGLRGAIPVRNTTPGLAADLEAVPGAGGPGTTPARHGAVARRQPAGAGEGGRWSLPATSTPRYARRRLLGADGGGRPAPDRHCPPIGSCRDSAWLFVTICGSSASRRFVSGYLVQLAADRAIDGPAARARTSQTSTRGPRSTSRAPAGSASTPPRPVRR